MRDFYMERPKKGKTTVMVKIFVSLLCVSILSTLIIFKIFIIDNKQIFYFTNQRQV